MLESPGREECFLTLESILGSPVQLPQIYLPNLVPKSCDITFSHWTCFLSLRPVHLQALVTPDDLQWYFTTRTQSSSDLAVSLLSPIFSLTLSLYELSHQVVNCLVKNQCGPLPLSYEES